jgi:hypothetical protein
MRIWPSAVALLLSLTLSGCVVGKAVGVVADVAVTTVDVTTDVIGGAADAVTGSDDDD